MKLLRTLFLILTKPSVSLRRRGQLPTKSGIYYAIRGFNVLYIGKSRNMRNRWNGKNEYRHHKLLPLAKLGGVRLYYRQVGEWRLDHEEALAIAKFNPSMNGRKEKPSRAIAIIDAVLITIAILVLAAFLILVFFA